MRRDQLKPETVAYLKGKHLSVVAFLDHARGGATQLYACKEEPRLTQTWHRPDRHTAGTTTWQVDGEPVADLDEAVARLSQPRRATEESAVHGL